MPSTSDQPDSQPAPTQTQGRILQAAAQVFAAKGYAGATTQAIAAAAGVNEVTLFRHFGTKQGLFMAVLSQYSTLPGLETALAEQLTGECRHDLMILGGHFLRTLAQRREAILMSLCEAERLPEVREVGGQILSRQRQLVANYLEAQMAQGRLRDLEPDLVAQVFLGMFFAYTISQVMLGEAAAPGVSSERVVEQFVGIFLDGVSSETR